MKYTFSIRLLEPISYNYTNNAKCPFSIVFGIFEKNKELAEAKLQIAKRFYEKERISLTELMAKEIAFEEAKVDKIKSIIEYEIIRLDLYKIMGREYR